MDNGESMRRQLVRMRSESVGTVVKRPNRDTGVGIASRARKVLEAYRDSMAKSVMRPYGQHRDQFGQRLPEWKLADLD